MPKLRPETVRRHLPRLRAVVVRAAKRKRLVPYGDLIADLGTARGWVIGQLLLALCEHEHDAGRPLLSAIVVLKQTGMPNDGFWQLPMVHVSSSPEARRRFWEAERDKVWRFRW